MKNDFPENLSAPALRALLNAKIVNLKELSTYTKKDISELHGMGPKGVKFLEEAMKAKKMAFKKKD